MYYIGGDFNADLLKSNSDINIKDFMNLTYSLGCIPLITQPTRITTTSSTLLDHVYTNNVVGEHKSFILVEDVSDHLPVMVCSNLSLPKSEKSNVTQIRDTKNFEVEKFLDKLTEGMELLGDIKEECIDNYTEKQKPYTCTAINVLLHFSDLRSLILQYNNVRGPTFPETQKHFNLREQS